LRAFPPTCTHCGLVAGQQAGQAGWLTEAAHRLSLPSCASLSGSPHACAFQHGGRACQLQVLKRGPAVEAACHTQAHSWATALVEALCLWSHGTALLVALILLLLLLLLLLLPLRKTCSAAANSAQRRCETQTLHK
jgi:hypothetical protein